MGAAVRFDANSFVDPRFDMLAKLSGVDKFSARMRVGYVWRHCTEQQTYAVDAAMIDVITERDGFADAMVRAGLAEEAPDGIRVKGLEGRIEWLAECRANAHKGGEANKARFVGSTTKPSRSASPTDTRSASRCQAVPEPSSSPLTPALSPDQKQEKILCEASASPDSGDDESDPEPPVTPRGDDKRFAELVLQYLNARTRARFTASDTHVRLIAARRASGYELDAFKRVIDDRCFRWLTDERMRPYLRPSTLFNKSKFESYVDEAQHAPGASQSAGARLAARIAEQEDR